MKSKKLLIMAGDSPVGDSDIMEKLRLTLGVTAGYREHKVDLVLFGDAVYLLQVPKDQAGLEKFFKSFQYNDFKIFVDSASAKTRNLKLDSPESPFKALEREELLKLLDGAEMTISL